MKRFLEGKMYKSRKTISVSKVLTLGLLYWAATNAHAHAIGLCPPGVVLSDGVWNEIANLATKSIPLNDHLALNEHIILVSKAEVIDPKTKNSCIVRNTRILQEGKDGEQTFTIVARIKVESGKINANTLDVTSTVDPYSTLNPTFSGVIASEDAALSKSGKRLDGVLGSAFSDLKPALAVRGASCMICHASVKANMITDFGLGDDYFFGSKDSSVNIRGDSMYFNHGNNRDSWQTGTISRSLIIPKTTLVKELFPGQFAILTGPERNKNSLTLAEYLRANTAAGPMALHIGDIQEKSSIYIGAPTEAELKALPDTANLDKIGIVFKDGYYTNASPMMECDGDIVLKNTLFLNSVTMKIGKNGCRLYVAGTIFIQHMPIYDVSESGALPVVQMTSSSAILMGFNYSILENRLEHKPGNEIERVFFLRAGDPVKLHEKILTEAKKIENLMQDAGDSHEEMKGLLLNAPEVYGRYKGQFTGAIIAELAFLRVGQFDFVFDENIVKDENGIFPLLEKPILKVTK
jgi:hypothetical protein